MSPFRVLKNCIDLHRKTLQGFDEKQNVEGLKKSLIKFGVQTRGDSVEPFGPLKMAYNNQKKLIISVIKK